MVIRIPDGIPWAASNAKYSCKDYASIGGGCTGGAAAGIACIVGAAACSVADTSTSMRPPAGARDRDPDWMGIQNGIGTNGG